MLIHPSLIEKVSLDSREHNADVAADIKRSFAYVGPITVVAHEPSAPEVPVNNEMHLICRMSRPYWTSEGDGDLMWEAMRTWLEATAYKVTSTIANFNKSRSEAGHQTVDYDRVELDMKPYAFGIACTQGDVLPADMAGIEAPAAASLAEQVENARVQAEAAVTAAAAADEGEAAEGEVVEAQGTPIEADEDQGAEAQADEAQAAPVEAGEAEVASEGAASAESEQPVENAEDAENDVPAGDEKPAEPEAPARLKHASDNLASLDYTMWDVRLADGTVRTLDSVAGTWA